MNDRASELMEVLDALPPLRVAEDYLTALIARNAQSAFGREHGFNRIKGVDDFRAQVPLRDYDGLRSWVDREVAGETQALTADPVLAFEMTTGTSGPRKLIPWTSGYQTELAQALRCWMRGWMTHRPDVMDGRAYWSVSPGFGKGERTPGGVPLGFSGDDAYFPGDVGQALGRWLVATEIQPGNGYFLRTIRALSEVDLSLVSVWSPTFFLRLDDAFQEIHGDKMWTDVWPGLATVSCWADAQSAAWRGRVEERAGIEIEPKGLVATEGVTSIPVSDQRVIADGVHFHEFIDIETDEVFVATELRGGVEYEVVLTTAAGLWRYRTGDLIRFDEGGGVVFLGRRGGGCDLVGEKVTQAAVIRGFAELGTRGFVAVDERRCCYTIYAEKCDEGVKNEMMRNPYFEQAVGLGQLAVVHSRLPDDWMRRWENYQVIVSGARLGDVKPPVLLVGREGRRVSEWLA